MALQDLPQDHDISHLKRSLPFVKNFRVAVDAGAHQGIWTKELMNHFDNVVSFEPVYSNFEKLKEINPDYSWNFALSDVPGATDMAPGTENTGQYHMVNGDSVPVINLDHIIFEYLDFLKLDVEGAELLVLMGAVDTIEEHHPVILLEENGLCKRYGIEPGEAGRFLVANDYVMVKKMNKDYLYEYRPSSTG